MKSFLLSPFLLLSMSLSPAADLTPGQPFPSLRLPDIRTGKADSLQNYRGEKVMLHLFASW